MSDIERVFGGWLVRNWYTHVHFYSLHSLAYDLEEKIIPEAQAQQREAYNQLRASEPHVPDLDTKLWLEPEYSFAMSYLPRILRYSYVIAVHSAVETTLNGLCDIGANSTKTNLRYQDLRGGAIDKPILYLEKVLNIHVPKDYAQWSELRTLVALRNAIVHCDGCDLKNKLVNYCTKHPDLIRRDSDGRLDVQGKYLPWIVERMQSFLEKLLDCETDASEAT